ncbi:MAG: PD40 domain-containing protein [Myxococcales bacterium]|nr:PD40 domain-containing protein [Myxococcales bacterium]
MRRVASTILLGVIAACPAASDQDRFLDEAAPVLERRCLAPACHGVAPGAIDDGEVIDRRFFFVDVDGQGRIRDAAAAYANVRARINTVEGAAWSTLLRKPLALAEGGVAHAGGHALGRDSTDWLALRAWIERETDGGEGTPRAELTPLEAQFADTVLPVLRDRGCMLARCHGTAQFAGLPLVPPMDGAGGAWSVAEIRANHHSARANLALVGDPARSRLLRKALPLDAGGISHRGGNDGFFPAVGGRAPLDDPGAQAILAWAAAERAALGAPAPVAGVVFVRGPIAPRTPLDLDAYHPGSDVWFYPGLTPGATPVNLTAAAHPEGPVEIRDPAVSHDGRRVAFAMRRGAAACFGLWEIGVDGAGLRQRTAPACTAGARADDRWPTWGPGDHLYFASTRAGHRDETGRRADLELYRLDDADAPVRLTFTPTPELTPSFLATGEFRGSLAFTTVRQRATGPRGAVFRFPPDHDRRAHLQPEYHPHHGQTAPAPLVLGMRELPDGRDVATLLGFDDRWQGGRLALLERQFGPDAATEAVTVNGFRHAWTMLTPDAGAAGVATDGLWRDPAPLPDGGLVVAHAPGPIDLDDVGAAPDTALTVAAIVDGRAGPRLGAPTVLFDSPGLADDQPAIVVARPDEDDPHGDVWDDGATGLLRHSGTAVNEAINRSLSPVIARPMRTDFAAVRLLAWPSWDAAPAVDPAQIANGDPASTWWSNGVHLPRTPLDQHALAADGSLLAAVPARTPIQVQVLDADGLAIGAQSQLWINVQGGEKFPQGTQPEHYPRLCAGCHGSLDGDPGHALGPIDPDAITMASVTQAAYRRGDPRRPLPAVRLGEGGAKDFDFGRDLAPSLARSCAVVGCHAGAAPVGGLDLTPTPTAYYDAAYEALQAWGAGSTGGKRYVDERGASARGSFLMEKLLGKELAAPRALDFRCPPVGAPVPPLDPDVIAAFAQWIDGGAVYRAPRVAVP